MHSTDELKEFIFSIIKLHETNDFNSLSTFISETEIKANSWFSEKRFGEVCEAIHNQLGRITCLEYISTLKRKSSYLTLWKATYSQCEDEVLWNIIIDSASYKIKLIHINWEHN